MLKLHHIQIIFSNPVIKSGNFEACYGQITGLVGKSGSGKSSMLNILGLNSSQKMYTYELDGVDINSLSEKQRQEIKRTKITYLPQNTTLLSSLNCFDQIAFAKKMAGAKVDKNEMLDILKMVDLETKVRAKPHSLSGGEKQRLALAMALAKGTDILLCDEITSLLDGENTDIIFGILKKLATTKQMMIILASHDIEMIQHCDAIFQIANQEVLAIKTSEKKDEKRELKQIFPMNKKLLLELPLSQIVKKPFSLLLSMIVCGIAVASLSCHLMFTYQGQKHQKNIHQLTCPNEMMIIHKGDNYVSTINRYSEFNFPFEKDMKNEIAEIEGVTAVYPYYQAALLGCDDKGQYEDNLLTILKDGQVVAETKISAHSDSNIRNFDISPYYPEQHLEKKCLQLASNHQGVYVSFRLLEDLGIEKLEDDMYLQTYIYVPIAYEIYYSQQNMSAGMIGVSASRSKVKMPNYIYQKIPVLLPISGVLRPEMQTPGQNQIMISYQEMMVFWNQAQQVYPLKENQLRSDMSAYQVYVQEGTSLQKVKQDILALSNTLATRFSYIYESWTYLYQDQIDFFYFYSIFALFLIVAGMMSVYSKFNQLEGQEDEKILINHGFTTTQRKIMNTIKTLIFTVMTFVVSLVFTNYLFKYGISWENQFKLDDGYVAVSLSLLVACQMGLSLLLSYISTFHTWKVNHKGFFTS